MTQEFYDKILEESMDEILKMREKIDFDRLIYNFKVSTSSINFGKFGGSLYIYGHMKNGDITLQQVEKQKDSKKELNEITSGNPKHKSNSQLYVIKNAKNLYNSIHSTLEAIYKSKQDKTMGTGLRILTPKQMLQRLPIALAQVKAGNNSEILLN